MCSLSSLSRSLVQVCFSVDNHQVRLRKYREGPPSSKVSLHFSQRRNQFNRKQLPRQSNHQCAQQQHLKMKFLPQSKLLLYHRNLNKQSNPLSLQQRLDGQILVSYYKVCSTPTTKVTTMALIKFWRSTALQNRHNKPSRHKSFSLGSSLHRRCN